MAPARQRLAAALAEVQIVAPECPIVSNVDAVARTDPEAIRRSLVEQVDHPVQWCQSVLHMKALGVTHALEIGPGRVLAGLVRRIDRTIRVLAVDSVGGIEKAAEFLELG
jgi:[acyl-carrier-protein] S-malonyltransferase